MATNLSKNLQRKLRLEQRNKASTDDEFLDSLVTQYATPVVPESVAEPTPETTVEPAAGASVTQNTITREQVVAKALQFWKDLKQYVKKNPDFKHLSDKAKLDLFRNKMGYDTFMTEFPIVARYMVCVGQFSVKAFNRFLDKLVKVQHPPPQERPKGYMEDEWIKRQADYVQYLWESYQKSHINTAERKCIWGEAYKRLKGEFDDFRTMHKDIEEKVKEEKVELAATNARELLERVSRGGQTLTDEETEFLLEHLIVLNYKKTYRHVLNELLTKRKPNGVTYESVGEGPESNRTVTMIETVDVDRMHEIDDCYRPAELRGMEPVPEEDITE